MHTNHLKAFWKRTAIGDLTVLLLVWFSQQFKMNVLIWMDNSVIEIQQWFLLVSYCFLSIVFL